MRITNVTKLPEIQLSKTHQHLILSTLIYEMDFPVTECGLVHCCQIGISVKSQHRIANSVDPDETAHDEPSHQALHRLHIYLFWSLGLKRWRELIFVCNICNFTQKVFAFFRVSKLFILIRRHIAQITFYLDLYRTVVGVTGIFSGI